MPPPLGVFLAPPPGDDGREVGVAGVEAHPVRHADSSLRLGFNFYLHSGVFFPPSFPCNYTATECLSSTSGWSCHFLPHVHRPGRCTLPPLALLPQQTSASPNLPENKLLDYVVTSLSTATPLLSVLLGLMGEPSVRLDRRLVGCKVRSVHASILPRFLFDLALNVNY